MPWPFMPSQCPSCRYFAVFEPYAEDDSGYRLPGVCRHPAIGMELFVPKDRPALAHATCELRWPRVSESSAPPPRRRARHLPGAGLGTEPRA